MALSPGFGGGPRSRHEGASKDRLMQSWVTGLGSGDLYLPDLPDLRARTRYLHQMDPHARAMIEQRVENVVGTGLRPDPQATPEETGLDTEWVKQWNRACKRQFALWARKEADATEHQTFWGLQGLWFRHRLNDGEAFVHPVAIREAGRRSTLALETVDPDRIVDPLVRASGVRIRSGIELGDRGQTEAYWITPSHPMDLDAYEGGRTNNPERYRRVVDGRPNVLHMFGRHQAGQSRGFPLLGASLVLFHLCRRVLRDEAVAVAVASRIAMFVERAQGGVPGEIAGVDEDGELLENIEPGTIEYLQPGEKISPFNPQRPGAQLDPFVVRLLRAIGASAGRPYELFTSDLARANYSSLRAVLLEVRRTYGCDQAELVDQLLQPIYELKIEELYFLGLLPTVPDGDFAGRRYELTQCSWIPPGWGQIEPQKERNASLMAIRGVLSTYARETMAGGGDFEANARTLAAEKAMLLALEEEFHLPPGSLLEQQGMADAGGTTLADESPSDENPDADEEDPAALRTRLDTRGLAVRSGLVTPQEDDEAATREELGMPPMSAAVRDAWKQEGGVRRPITLAKADENPANQPADEGDQKAPPPANDETDDDDTEDEGNDAETESE